MTLYVFWAKDDSPLQKLETTAMVSALTVAGHAHQLVEKSSSDVETLKLVARHKIITTPSIVLTDETDEVVYRCRELPKAKRLLRILTVIQDRTDG